MLKFGAFILVGAFVLVWISTSLSPSGKKSRTDIATDSQGSDANDPTATPGRIQIGFINKNEVQAPKPKASREVLYLKRNEPSKEVVALDGYPVEHNSFTPKVFPIDFLLEGSGNNATVRQKRLKGTFYKIEDEKEVDLGVNTLYQAVEKTTGTVATYRFRFPASDGSVVLVTPNY